jgi:hypothetical protein
MLPPPVPVPPPTAPPPPPVAPPWQYEPAQVSKDWQEKHVTPLRPHLIRPGGVTHSPPEPPSQQPFPHDTESHTHAPSTQRLPGPHGGEPAPQAQLPPLQTSASVELQLVHGAPPVPQN